MMPLRRASVIAMLPVVCWTATASAECGWVLWSGKSNPKSGYETRQACEALRTTELMFGILGNTSAWHF